MGFLRSVVDGERASVPLLALARTLAALRRFESGGGGGGTSGNSRYNVGVLRSVVERASVSLVALARTTASLLRRLENAKHVPCNFVVEFIFISATNSLLF